jgi:hypothetical protein
MTTLLSSLTRLRERLEDDAHVFTDADHALLDKAVAAVFYFDHGGIGHAEHTLQLAQFGCARIIEHDGLAGITRLLQLTDACVRLREYRRLGLVPEPKQ